MAERERLVIRASSTSSYPDCPRRWASRTLRREIRAAGYTLRDEPRGIGMGVGISIHEAARLTLDEKARSGSLPPIAVATDIALDTLKEQIKLGVQYDQRITVNADDAHIQVARMARSYHAVVAPKIEPIIIEQRLEAEIPWSENNLIISGQPDVVAREPGTIVDLKSGSRLGYHLPQIGSYALLAQANAITDVEQGRIDWVPRVTVKKPQPDPMMQAINVAQAEQIATNTLKSIDMSITTWRQGDEQRGLKPGDPSAFLSNPASMLCGSKWCSAHSCGANGWCTDYRSAEDWE